MLLIPLVGFLPADDERVIGTVDAVGRTLDRDGLIARYEADEENAEVDGLPPGEGVFLPCSFWYAADLALIGRADEARALFTRLLGLRNDLGLLSEEYDPAAGRHARELPAGVHAPGARRLRATSWRRASLTAAPSGARSGARAGAPPAPRPGRRSRGRAGRASRAS